MKLDLEELRRLHEAATPGPWGNYSWGGQCHINHQHDGSACKYDLYRLEGRDWDRCVSADEGSEIVGYGEDGPVLSRSDATMIVFARNALPALLARAEVYEAAVALIAAEDMPPHTPFDGNSPEWDAKFDAEHVARKALRAAVARVQEVENG